MGKALIIVQLQKYQDDFGRRVYLSKKGNYFKDTDIFNTNAPTALYPAAGFYGEPEYPMEMSRFQII